MKFDSSSTDGLGLSMETVLVGALVADLVRLERIVVRRDIEIGDDTIRLSTAHLAGKYWEGCSVGGGLRRSAQGTCGSPASEGRSAGSRLYLRAVFADGFRFREKEPSPPADGRLLVSV